MPMPKIDCCALSGQPLRADELAAGVVVSESVRLACEALALLTSEAQLTYGDPPLPGEIARVLARLERLERPIRGRVEERFLQTLADLARECGLTVR